MLNLYLASMAIVKHRENQTQHLLPLAFLRISSPLRYSLCFSESRDN